MNLKILTQKEFEAEIKQIQRDKFPITMIDAILEYCTIKNVEVVDYGLSNKNEYTQPLRLNKYDPAFQVGAAGLPLVKIDSLVANNILNKINFIKLDVEGSEVDALLGAQRSISIFQPKLAISVYHKPDDLFEIPLLIKRLFPFYNHITLEHYSIQMGESVLYASM